MKKIILLALLISTQTYCQNQINWHTNIEDSLQIAKDQNKTVFLYFGTKKCVPCKTVEKYEYSNPEFIKYSEKLVMIKIYDDLDTSNKKWQYYIKSSREKYKVEINPKFILIKNEKIIASFFKYVKKPNDLMKKIDAYLTK